YRGGASLEEAAVEAARVRLRPIVMTSIAFILGCVPMAIASGAGANSLHAIGTGVIGGMLASTLIASFFVPMFFVILESLSERGEHKDKTNVGEIAAATPGATEGH
ncbi:MAG: efflux RND transporter permease subunit, partial [Gammaproteobacteria bacterium]